MQTNSRKKQLLLLHNMALHKIQLQFSDQLFGYAWAIVNPIVYIFSFWFFAYVGLKGGEVQGFPFVVWVVPGLLAYRFVSGVFSHSSSILTSNSMLIKETEVDVRIIPLIEALKETYIHLGVMIVMFFVYALIGYTMTETWVYLPTLYYLNFIYYFITAFAFITMLSYIFSAIGVLFRDTKNFIGALMVPLFWTTPVLFSVENGVKPLLEKLEMLFNPFYYFIHGYRNTMLYQKFFFEDIAYNIYIWVVIITMALIAKKIWKFILPIISDLL